MAAMALAGVFSRLRAGVSAALLRDSAYQPVVVPAGMPGFKPLRYEMRAFMQRAN